MEVFEEDTEIDVMLMDLKNKCRCCFRFFIDDQKKTIPITKEIATKFLELTNIEVCTI